MTIIGVIPHALKENWNPLIHLSLEINRKLFHKGKGLGKGILTHVGHASIFIEAMDARWQWSNTCDTRVTPSGL
jgi:hypothetical protein